MHVFLAPFRRQLGPESIREVVFGTEDGLVQNMTLIAGMVGATLSSEVIVVAGLVNAVAGVVAMSVGTFLSSQAERDALRASGVMPAVVRAPVRDALVMALAYGIGAAVPLLPFLLPLGNRTVTVLAALAATAVALFVLGVVKAEIGNRGRVRSGLELLALASAAGLVGYGIGRLAESLVDLTP